MKHLPRKSAWSRMRLIVTSCLGAAIILALAIGGHEPPSSPAREAGVSPDRATLVQPVELAGFCVFGHVHGKHSGCRGKGEAIACAQSGVMGAMIGSTLGTDPVGAVVGGAVSCEAGALSDAMKNDAPENVDNVNTAQDQLQKIFPER